MHSVPWRIWSIYISFPTSETAVKEEAEKMSEIADEPVDGSDENSCKTSMILVHHFG